MTLDVSDEQIDGLCTRLQTVGSAVTGDAAGKRLFLVASGILDLGSAPALLVAWEGQGAFLWDIASEPDLFRLIQSGFGISLAPTLVQLLLRLKAGFDRARVDGSGGARPRLGAPRGQ